LVNISEFGWNYMTSMLNTQNINNIKISLGLLRLCKTVKQ